MQRSRNAARLSAPRYAIGTQSKDTNGSYPLEGVSVHVTQETDIGYPAIKGHDYLWLEHQIYVSPSERTKI